MFPFQKCIVTAVLLGFGVCLFPAFAEDPGKVFAALLNAYPDKVSNVQFQNGDWTITINGKTLYWAGGRILPEDELQSKDRYKPHRFYPYTSDLPPIRKLDEAAKSRLNATITKQEARKDTRSTSFLDALWGMENRRAASTTVVTRTFLGKSTDVHPDIANQLKLVEQEILDSAKKNQVVRNWLNHLYNVDGFVWRDIAGSGNRSLHSYGIALDLTLRDYMKKHVYWRWTKQFVDDWWSIPYKDRYLLPTPVITAFENHGFTWGGKWFFFDQVHFEYRPELLILGGL